MERINSVDELCYLLNDETPEEFFISMGPVRSSKNIMFIGTDKLSIYNEIDDTEDIVKIADLKAGKCDDITNVGIAINAGKFYSYSHIVVTNGMRSTIQQASILKNNKSNTVTSQHQHKINYDTIVNNHIHVELKPKRKYTYKITPRDIDNSGDIISKNCMCYPPNLIIIVGKYVMYYHGLEEGFMCWDKIDKRKLKKLIRKERLKRKD